MICDLLAIAKFLLLIGNAQRFAFVLGAWLCWLSAFLSSFNTSCFLSLCIVRTVPLQDVCLFVTCRYSVETVIHVLKLFTVGYSHILFFPYQMVWLYSDGDHSDHLNECFECKGGTKKPQHQYLALAFISEMIQDRLYLWPTNGLSNGTEFNDLQLPFSKFLGSRHSLSAVRYPASKYGATFCNGEGRPMFNVSGVLKIAIFEH